MRLVLVLVLACGACAPSSYGFESHELAYGTGNSDALESQHVRSRTREFLHPKLLQVHEYRDLPAPRLEEVCTHVLSTSEDRPYAVIDESRRVIEGKGFYGIVRRLEITPFETGKEILVEVEGMTSEDPHGHTSGPPTPFDDSLEYGGRNGWIVEPHGEGGGKLLVWSRPPGVRFEGAGRLRVTMDVARALELAVVNLEDWSLESEEQRKISQELENRVLSALQAEIDF